MLYYSSCQGFLPMTISYLRCFLRDHFDLQKGTKKRRERNFETFVSCWNPDYNHNAWGLKHELTHHVLL